VTLDPSEYLAPGQESFVEAWVPCDGRLHSDDLAFALAGGVISVRAEAAAVGRDRIALRVVGDLASADTWFKKFLELVEAVHAGRLPVGRGERPGPSGSFRALGRHLGT
jgi:hypothetical protein